MLDWAGSSDTCTVAGRSKQHVGAVAVLNTVLMATISQGTLDSASVVIVHCMWLYFTACHLHVRYYTLMPYHCVATAWAGHLSAQLAA